MSPTERIWAISFLLTVTMTVVPAIRAAPDSSGPVGTWYLNANNARLTLTIASGPQTGAFSGTLADETEGGGQIDNVTWNPASRLLEFRQTGAGFWRWHRGTVVEGIFVGRFSNDKTSPSRQARAVDLLQISRHRLELNLPRSRAGPPSV
jgi:hypothetical protein